LFQAGDMQRVNLACSEAEFGKLMPTALYVHVSGLSKLAPVLRVYEGCARVLSGEIAGATILKLRRSEPKISYLSYPDFDTDPHPALEFSVRVDLRSFGIRSQDFRNSENRPILHRKELFVPRDYPGRETFEELTSFESNHGLLDESQNIGLQAQWNEHLRARGWQFQGNKLIAL
jgi:DNA phosphorothioation-associated putative methyltransferase